MTGMIRGAFWGLWMCVRWFASRLWRRPRGWVTISVGPHLAEHVRAPSLMRRLGGLLPETPPTSLSWLRRLVDLITADPGIGRVVIELHPLSAGWAACASLRTQISKLRKAGKAVDVVLPTGGSNRDVFVSSAADRIFMAPQTMLAPLGLSLEIPYIKSLLSKLGVHVQSVTTGPYKTATEFAERDDLSSAQREQYQALLGGLASELTQAVSERLQLKQEDASHFFDQPMMRARVAVERGFATDALYPDQVTEELKKSNSDSRARSLKASEYMALRRIRFRDEWKPKQHIALIQIAGVIADHGPSAPLRRSRNIATARSVVPSIKEVAENPNALGVLLYVDSPGGSAIASDLMYHEILRLREEKPVVAYMGEVAASGGYYVSAGAHSIVCQPQTVTGSIGVLSAKPVFSDLLARAGVRNHVLRMTEHADIFSVSRAFSEQEREFLQKEMRAFYDEFLRIVAEGRKKTVEEVDQLAQGRVWCGADAVRKGLVDRLGDLEIAIEEVRARVPCSDKLRSRLPIKRYAKSEGKGMGLPFGLRLTPELACESLSLQDIIDLATLFQGRERAFYYAPSLPRFQ